jgi:CheY-like chemotaxis protein
MTNCRSILVVDDNDDVRDTVVNALAMEGYQVSGAKNGRDALVKLAQLPAPTLILLDLMMPEMNGWEFLEAQGRDASINENPVVTMSAVDLKHGPENALPLKIAGSLQKPISLANLFDKVEEFCKVAHPHDPPLTAQTL